MAVRDVEGHEAAEPGRGLLLDIVDASVTGVRKPDPRAFGAAARALGLPPGRIVFLDDMPWNVAAAAQAGLLAVRVPPGGPGPAVDTARDLLGLRPRVS